MAQYSAQSATGNEFGHAGYGYGQALIDSMNRSIRRTIPSPTQHSAVLDADLTLDLMAAPTTITALNAEPDELAMTPLPSKANIEDLIDIAFHQLPTLAVFIDEDSFRNLTDRLYTTPTAEYPQALHYFTSLFYWILTLALPYTHQSQLRRHSCETTLIQCGAFLSIAEAKSRAIGATSLVRLHVMVCKAVYLLQVSSMTAARAQLREVCRTLSVTTLARLSDDTADPDTTGSTALHIQGLLLLIVDLDLYVAGSLGITPFSNVSAIKKKGADLILTAASNSRTLTRTSRSMMLSVAHALQIDLQVIMSDMVALATTEEQSSSLAAVGASPSRGTIPEAIMRIEADLKNWHQMFNAIFPTDEVNPQVARARFDLDMNYFLARILLYRNALAETVEQSPTAMMSQSRAAYYRMSYVSAASKAVAASTRFMQAPSMSIDSFKARHSLLTSLTCLALDFAAADRLSWTPTAATTDQHRQGVARSFINGYRLFRQTDICRVPDVQIAKLAAMIRDVPGLGELISQE